MQFLDYIHDLVNGLFAKLFGWREMDYRQIDPLSRRNAIQRYENAPKKMQHRRVSQYTNLGNHALVCSRTVGGIIRIACELYAHRFTKWKVHAYKMPINWH